MLPVNFAYNPSCAYLPPLDVPALAPRQPLEIPVDAGELLPPG